MKTVLKSKSKEVVIDTEGPVVVIGESINPTRRKKLVTGLQERNFDYVLELAQLQIDAMADILDVNVGYPGVDDAALLPETVTVIQNVFDIPLCLDSPNPKAIEAALEVTHGKCIINSVNGEEESLNAVLPLAAGYGAAVIGLTMDDDGIMHDPEKRFAIAEKILNRAVAAGIKPEDVVIDPLAMAVSADQNACIVTLETIRLIHERLDLNITLGCSNVSFGLPDRSSLNNAFVALAIKYGLTCPIANPEKIVPAIRATDVLLGRDDYAMRFIELSQRD
jgi:5-methyltetrahydrofolate--homocysteine methyltransferase